MSLALAKNVVSLALAVVAVALTPCLLICSIHSHHHYHHRHHYLMVMMTNTTKSIGFYVVCSETFQDESTIYKGLKIN